MINLLAMLVAGVILISLAYVIGVVDGGVLATKGEMTCAKIGDYRAKPFWHCSLKENYFE